MGTMNVSARGDESNMAGNYYVQERIGKMKDRLLSASYKLDLDRAKHYTRAYKQTEGQPACIRAARGLEETLRNMPIRIDEEELIAGSKSSKDFSDPLYIEATVNYAHIRLALNLHGTGKTVDDWVSEDPEHRDVSLGTRGATFSKDVPNVSEEEYRELKDEIVPYWKDKTVNARKLALWKQEGVSSLDARGLESWFSGELPPQGHVSIGIKKVLDMGFNGIARQAAERLTAFQDAFAKGKIEERAYLRKKDFLEAAKISAEAVCEFAGRYAELAQEMAQKAEGQRKSELLEIAERCRRVPAEPARNFMEALQAVWLTQAVVLISYGGNSITCPGRIDQFLYPYYKQDLDGGKMTRRQALDAVMEYIVKLASTVYFGPNNLTIGGIDKNGNNAVNDVSTLFLEAHRALKGCGRMGLAVRISPNTPREFLTAACEVHRDCAGIAFYNDEVVMKGLMEDGYSLEDARDYSVVGCAEPTGTGNNNGYTATNGVLLAALLELILNEGKRYPVNWKQVGRTVYPIASFKTFDDIKKAFAEELTTAVEKCVKAGYLKDQVIAENFPLPLLSSTIEGCVESGEDMTRGGATYNHVAIGNCSLATVVDSLAAIKWAVYDQKLLTLEELVECLRSNFEGKEDIRQRLRHAPKYGNDDKAVDELAVWVADIYNKESRKHPFWMGGVHRPYMLSNGSHISWGALIGATADGRLAGTPLSNGVSPSNGTERNGLTAVLQSVARVCSVPISDGTILNTTINPMTIRTEEGLNKFASLIDGYFAMGGRQVQFNPLSRDMLLDAQIHPENYPGMVVKVSGISFRYIDLPKHIQDDIIARTEFGVA
ncbi:MAG: hypothetical protein JW943_09990 [Deltaproteobacteria bacterium]|nr:hypothetical protein [Deltaproteobacteria bacterium]